MNVLSLRSSEIQQEQQQWRKINTCLNDLQLRLQFPLYLNTSDCVTQILEATIVDCTI